MPALISCRRFRRIRRRPRASRRRASSLRRGWWRTCGRRGEAFLADADQRAGAGFLGPLGCSRARCGARVPSDDGFLRATVAGDPGVDEQARGIDFEIFAFDVECLAVGADCRRCATCRRGGGPWCDSVTRYRPACPHHLRELVGIGDGLEDAGRAERR